MGRVVQASSYSKMGPWKHIISMVARSESVEQVKVQACRTVHFDEEIGVQEVLFGGNAGVLIKTRPVLLIMVM